MQVLLNCIYFILTLCIYLNIWLEYFNLSNRCLTEVKILILIIALCLFANILLLFINVMFFLNKSKQFIYILVINNIISIITLLMCINYIKGLLIESDWAALLDIVPFMVQILSIYFLCVCVIQIVLVVLFCKKTNCWLKGEFKWKKFYLLL